MMDDSIVLELENSFSQQEHHNITQENSLCELTVYDSTNSSSTTLPVMDSTELSLFQEQEDVSSTSFRSNHNIYVSSICNPDAANIDGTAFSTEDNRNSIVCNPSSLPKILHIVEFTPLCLPS